MKFYSIFLLLISVACTVSCNKDDEQEVTAINYIQATFIDDEGRIDYYGQEENGFLRVSTAENGDKTELVISSRDALTDVVVTIRIKDYQGAGIYDVTTSSENSLVVLFTEREILYFPLDGALNFEITSTADNRITGTFSGEITHGANSTLKKPVQNGFFTVPKTNF